MLQARRDVQITTAQVVSKLQPMPAMPHSEPQDNRAERNSERQDSHESTGHSGETVMDRLRRLQERLDSSTDSSNGANTTSAHAPSDEKETNGVQPETEDVSLSDFVSGSRDHAGNGEDTDQAPEAEEKAKETSDAPDDIGSKVDALLKKHDRLRWSEPNQMENDSTANPSNATQNDADTNRDSPPSMFDIASQTGSTERGRE